MATATAPTPPAAPAGRSSPGLAAWLRTREGRITAAGAAVVLVVVIGLARRSGRGAAAPFTAEGLQGGPDTTLQDRLDQLGLRGGTIEELIGSTSDLTTGLADLNGRIDQLKPATGGATAAKIAELVQFNAVKANYLKTLGQLNAQRPGIVSRLQKDPKARGQLATLDKVRTQVNKSLSIVNQQIAARST